MTRKKFNLFNSPDAEEIPLANSPLRMALCQISYPRILSVSDESFVGSFQDLIRQTYPLTANEFHPIIDFNNGAIQQSGSRLWKFSDLTGDWTVTLAQDFIALKSTGYVSREDFLSRMRELIEAAAKTLRPTYAHKVGMRYINQFELQSDDDAMSVFRDNYLSVYNSLDHGAQDYSLTDIQLHDSEVGLRARWGALPPHATHDPNITAVELPSLFLDLDATTLNAVKASPFDGVSLLPTIESLSKSCYKFFRWAISDTQIEKMRN